jgi:hypothetical protein
LAAPRRNLFNTSANERTGTRGNETHFVAFLCSGRLPPTPFSSELFDLGVGDELLDSPGILPSGVRDVASL